MGFGLFFPGLGGRHQVQVDDALGQSLLVAADLAPAYQPGAGGRRPHAGAELLHGALVDVLDLADGASPKLAPPISNLALVRIQMKPRGIAPATSRAAASRGMGGEGRAIGASVQE